MVIIIIMCGFLSLCKVVTSEGIFGTLRRKRRSLERDPHSRLLPIYHAVIVVIFVATFFVVLVSTVISYLSADRVLFETVPC